MVGHEGLD
jgi:hypothetical protein